MPRNFYGVVKRSLIFSRRRNEQNKNWSNLSMLEEEEAAEEAEEVNNRLAEDVNNYLDSS